jgi:hypothetical protein
MESALSTIVCFVVIFDLLAIVLSAFIKRLTAYDGLTGIFRPFTKITMMLLLSSIMHVFCILN